MSTPEKEVMSSRDNIKDKIISKTTLITANGYNRAHVYRQLRKCLSAVDVKSMEHACYFVAELSHTESDVIKVCEMIVDELVLHRINSNGSSSLNLASCIDQLMRLDQYGRRAGPILFEAVLTIMTQPFKQTIETLRPNSHEIPCSGPIGSVGNLDQVPTLSMLPTIPATIPLQTTLSRTNPLQVPIGHQALTGQLNKKNNKSESDGLTVNDNVTHHRLPTSSEINDLLSNITHVDVRVIVKRFVSYVLAGHAKTSAEMMVFILQPDVLRSTDINETLIFQWYDDDTRHHRRTLPPDRSVQFMWHIIQLCARQKSCRLDYIDALFSLFKVGYKKSKKQQRMVLMVYAVASIALGHVKEKGLNTDLINKARGLVDIVYGEISGSMDNIGASHESSSSCFTSSSVKHDTSRSSLSHRPRENNYASVSGYRTSPRTATTSTGQSSTRRSTKSVKLPEKSVEYLNYYTIKAIKEDG